MLFFICEVVHYVPEQHVIDETAELLVAGEDEDACTSKFNEKPIRNLMNFTFFDPIRNNEVVPLSVLEDDGENDQRIEGVGIVFAYLDNDEDEGQIEDIDMSENDPGIQVRLRKISRAWVDYERQDKWASHYLLFIISNPTSSAILVETPFAWYILKMPSAMYNPFYCSLYLPVRVAQLLIVSVKSFPERTYADFLSTFLGAIDNVVGRPYVENDVLLAVRTTR